MPEVVQEWEGYAVIDEHWAHIHVQAMVVLAGSIVGSLYVLYRAVYVDHLTRSIGDRFPIYVSIWDCLFSAFHFSDHLYIYATEHFPAAGLGTFLGFGNIQFLLGNNILVLVIAISIWRNMNTSKTYRIDFGPYDWQLLFVCLGLPFLLAMTVFITDSYGPAYYYVWITSTTQLGLMLNLLCVTIPSLLSQIVLTFCTFQVIKTVKATFAATGKLDAAKRPIKRMAAYCVVAIIQMTPINVLGVLGMFGYGHWFLVLMVVTFTNISGICNAMVYTYHMSSRHTSGGKTVTGGTSSRPGTSDADQTFV